MRAVSREEMIAIDRTAIDEHGISGISLMESAGQGIADWIRKQSQGQRQKTRILCGPGNNGGDGFVAARHLLADGINVRVLLLARPEQIKGDAKIAYDAWLQAGGKSEVLIFDECYP